MMSRRRLEARDVEGRIDIDRPGTDSAMVCRRSLVEPALDACRLSVSGLLMVDARDNDNVLLVTGLNASILVFVCECARSGSMTLVCDSSLSRRAGRAICHGI